MLEELYDFSSIIYFQEYMHPFGINNYSSVEFENAFQTLKKEVDTWKRDDRHLNQEKGDLTYFPPLFPPLGPCQVQ